MSRFQNKNKIWINNTLKSASEVSKVLEILKDIGVFREKPKKRKPKKAKEEEEAQGDIAGDLASSGFFPSTDATSSIQALKSAVSAQAQTQAAKEQAQIEAGQQVDEMQRINENPFPKKEIVVAGTNYEFGRSAGAIPEDVRNEDISPVASATEGIMEDIDTGGFNPKDYLSKLEAELDESMKNNKYEKEESKVVFERPKVERGDLNKVLEGFNQGAGSGVFSEPLRYKGKKESLTSSSAKSPKTPMLDKTAWIEERLNIKRPKGNASADQLESFALYIAEESGIPFELNRNKETNLTRYRKILNDEITDLIDKIYEKAKETGDKSPRAKARI